MKISLTLSEVEIKHAVDAWIRSKKAEFTKGYPTIEIELHRNDHSGEFEAVVQVSAPPPMGSGRD